MCDSVRPVIVIAGTNPRPSRNAVKEMGENPSKYARLKKTAENAGLDSLEAEGAVAGVFLRFQLEPGDAEGDPAFLYTRRSVRFEAMTIHRRRKRDEARLQRAVMERDEKSEPAASELTIQLEGQARDQRWLTILREQLTRLNPVAQMIATAFATLKGKDLSDLQAYAWYVDTISERDFHILTWCAFDFFEGIKPMPYQGAGEILRRRHVITSKSGRSPNWLQRAWHARDDGIRAINDDLGCGGHRFAPAETTLAFSSWVWEVARGLTDPVMAEAVQLREFGALAPILWSREQLAKDENSRRRNRDDILGGVHARLRTDFTPAELEGHRWRVIGAAAIDEPTWSLSRRAEEARVIFENEVKLPIRGTLYEAGAFDELDGF